MQINVVNIIIDSLLAKGSCSVESLGTFTLDKKSAAFIKGKTELEGPTSQVNFSETVDGKNPLYLELLEVYPFSETKSKKVVSIFANKVINGLLNFDQVNLTNLGTLKKEDQSIKFSLSSALDRILNKSLPNIALTPFLDAKKEVAKEKKRNESEQEVITTEIPKVTQKITPVQPAPKVQKSETKIVEQVKPKETPARTITKTSNKVPPVQARPIYEEDNEGFFSRFLPWILLFGLIAIVGWGLMKFIALGKANYEKTEMVIKEETIPDESYKEVSEAAQNIKKEAVSMEIIEKAKEEELMKVVRPSECIIITGSFMMNENIDEMANKIRALGYEVYTEKYGYYIRVGFAFPCDDEDLNLKLFIEEIRAKLSKSAWYLVPDLTI